MLGFQHQTKGVTMAHGKRSWFKLYPYDWLLSPEIRALSPAARGVLIDLICSQWESPTGWIIPKDETDLCRMGRCSLRTLRRVVREIWSLVEEEEDPISGRPMFRFPGVLAESRRRTDDVRRIDTHQIIAFPLTSRVQ
jgi:hypothetical protein